MLMKVNPKISFGQTEYGKKCDRSSVDFAGFLLLKRKITLHKGTDDLLFSKSISS